MSVKAHLKGFFASEDFKRSRKVCKARAARVPEIKARIGAFLRGDEPLHALAGAIRAAVDEQVAIDGGIAPLWGFGGPGTANFIATLVGVAPEARVESELRRALAGVDIRDPSDRLKGFAAFVARTARENNLGPESPLHLGYAVCFLSYCWHILYDLEVPVFYGGSHRGVKCLIVAQAIEDPDYGSRELDARFRAFLRILRYLRELVRKVSPQLNFWTAEAFLVWFATSYEAASGGAGPGESSGIMVRPVEPPAEPAPLAAVGAALAPEAGAAAEAETTRKRVKRPSAPPGRGLGPDRVQAASTERLNEGEPSPAAPGASPKAAAERGPEEPSRREAEEGKAVKKDAPAPSAEPPKAASEPEAASKTPASPPAPEPAPAEKEATPAVATPPAPPADRVEPPPEGADAAEQKLADLAQETGFPVHLLKDLEMALVRRGQVAIEGPTGVGKTYLARRFAAFFAGSPSRVRFVQLHPGFRYEDFVEGSTGNGPVPGVFKTFAARAAGDPTHRYVIVLDELGRADFAALLGEVYSLLEYRDSEATLPVSREAFSIPKNLFVIATASTFQSRRSLEDPALRRRFHFVELGPSSDLLRSYLRRMRPTYLWVADLLVELNRRLARDVGPRAPLGQSLFMQPHLDDAELERIFLFDVRPLLEGTLRDPARLAEYELASLRTLARGSGQGCGGANGGA